MNECYFCSQSLEDYSHYCYNCNIACYRDNLVAYFLFDDNKIYFINLAAHNITINDKICKISYFYKDYYGCYIDMHNNINNKCLIPSIEFEIKPNQFTSFKEFKKIIEKHLRFSYLT